MVALGSSSGISDWSRRVSILIGIDCFLTVGEAWRDSPSLLGSATIGGGLHETHLSKLRTVASMSLLFSPPPHCATTVPFASTK